MSGKREVIPIHHTNSATHVYIKQDNPLNLCPKYEGPYKIIARPSRSTVLVKLGIFKSGEPRLQKYHWDSLKVANLRDGAQIASRPALGRRPNPATVQTDAGPFTDMILHAPTHPAPTLPDIDLDHENVNNQNDVENTANIQNTVRHNPRPQRSTRNNNPIYKT